MANIHILGCHHSLQSVAICKRWVNWREWYELIGKDVHELARQQKDHFAARVQEIVRDKNISVIGEECDEEVVTAASLVVRNWHPIDMPSVLRREKQIPLDYADSDADYTGEQRNNWNREREQHMFETFLARIGDASSGLVICGSEHLGGLTGLFSNAGHVVTSEDVTKADWFDPPLGSVLPK